MMGAHGVSTVLVHTYRLPRYVASGCSACVAAVGGCASSVKAAVSTDYLAVLSEVGHQDHISSDQAMPVFVFAAALLLRIGNEGPVPAMREGYAAAVTWADKVVEAVLPVKA